MMEPYLRLSQGHLSALDACDRKFQHLVLDRLNVPPVTPQKDALERGSRFHLLVQQRELGLDVEPFLAADEDLRSWFERFDAAAPSLFDGFSAKARRFPEREVRCQFNDFILTARYDLLVCEDDRGAIFDWKTHFRPPDPLSKLARDWQTQLYLFLLAETSDLAPGNMSMTYWFARGDRNCDRITFAYSQASHERIKTELQQLLDRLKVALQQYRDGVPLLQVAREKGICANCAFAIRCDRAPSQAESEPFDLASIPEVAL